MFNYDNAIKQRNVFANMTIDEAMDFCADELIALTNDEYSENEFWDMMEEEARLSYIPSKQKKDKWFPD